MKIVVSVSCLISHCGMRSSSENIDSTEHTRGGVQVEPWTERCDMRGSAYGEARGDALAQTASILDQLNYSLVCSLLPKPTYDKIVDTFSAQKICYIQQHRLLYFYVFLVGI